MARLRNIFDILKAAVQDFLDDKASRLAAALAYYGIFSLAPMLLIAIVVAGFVLGDSQEARDEVLNQTEEWMGSDARDDLIAPLIDNVQRPEALTLGALVALGTLIWAGTGLFANLQGALNHIWEVEPEGGGIVGFLEKRAFSFLMVIVLGLLLLALLVASTTIDVLSEYFSDVLPVHEALVQVANVAVSFALLVVLFATMYKVLPDVKMSWSDTWIGAGITALLFAIGLKLVGLYLGRASPGGAAAAAASFIVLIVWIYYSAQIVLFGGELTQVVANRYGKGIVPEEGARYRPGAKRAPAQTQAQAEGQGVPSAGSAGPQAAALVGAANAPDSPPGRPTLKPGFSRPKEPLPERPRYVLEAPAALAAYAMGILGFLIGGALTAVGFALKRRL